MNRAEILAMIDERIDAAITAGKTCATIAERHARGQLLARQEADAIRIELAARATEIPIPPWVSITLSPTSARGAIKTPLVHALGPNGMETAVAGGFEITRHGAASRIEVPATGVASMRALDPVFAQLLETGELVLTPLTEAEARPLEEHARRFRQAGQTTAATAVGTPRFGGHTGGVFHASPTFSR